MNVRRAVRLGFSGGGALAILATLAVVLDRPLVLPSLGPTALVLLVRDRTGAVPAPRVVIAGHAIGALAGLAALWGFGLGRSLPDRLDALTVRRAAAVTAAITLAFIAMALARSIHPPAAATTLVFALGVLRTPVDAGFVLVAVILLVVMCALLRPE